MRNLILTGGAFHDFAATTSFVARLLEDVGIDSETSDDIEAGLASAGRYELLTFNTLRWRMLGEMFDGHRPRWGMSLSEEGRAAVHEHLGRGRGILALHTASVCFDDWPEWGQILGAQWDWSRSSHPPPRPSQIRVAAAAHPIVAGLGDFEVEDEIYSFLAYQPDIEPLATSPRGGIDQPLLWVREVGGGRVAYDALGHDVASLAHPTHSTIVRRAALWALGQPVDGEVPVSVEGSHGESVSTPGASESR